MDTSTWQALGAADFLHRHFIHGINWYAVLLAFLVPVLLIWAKHEILLKRLRAILDFMLSFQLYDGGNNGNSKPDRYNPSFEFVKSKYISDIDISPQQQQVLDSLDGTEDKPNQHAEEDRLKKYIEFATRSGSRTNKGIYLAAIGFIITCYYGFKAIFGAVDCNFTAILSPCSTNAGSINQQMLVIGGLAFAGAFVASVRMLLRALALYDLTAYSFLRHTGEMIFSILLVMLIYRAFPDPFFHFGKLMLSDSVVTQLTNIENQQRELIEKQQQLENQNAMARAESEAGEAQPTSTQSSGSDEPAPATDSTTDQKSGAELAQIGTDDQPKPSINPASDTSQEQAVAKGEVDTSPSSLTPNVLPTRMGPTDKGIPWVWFAFAPVLGLLPFSASKFLLIKMQSLVSWTKTTDDRFADVSKVISLDIIDGIDFETRFRLEECGIYDVQNLATYNPVMLHIETPYGIYQTIDWIAQAQLCHIVGHEKFLMFREVNIRTIFDLERAIDSIYSPEAFDDIYASILFAPTENLRKAAAISQFKFLIADRDNTLRQVSVDEFCAWARGKIRANGGTGTNGAPDPELTKAVEHLMAWISDDLHIRRLRRLWIDISDSLGESAEFFKDSKRCKARQAFIDGLCTKWCETKAEEQAKAAEEGENQIKQDEVEAEQTEGEPAAVEPVVEQADGAGDGQVAGQDPPAPVVAADQNNPANPEDDTKPT
ncbi:hypothetical protein JJB09_22860 [Rhizobium sp. KVB221]|uniref:Uncharacterized protein n=1 Tax=Rhizobium setariae TaxID=2801340 RepID=A0A937CR45_9HYPH|nr:hypothetical protein [Rhizobium setariae]MBL0374858.1 hypothetical protein [Rhizobium setariae]